MDIGLLSLQGIVSLLFYDLNLFKVNFSKAFFFTKVENIMRQPPILCNYSYTQEESGHMVKECMAVLYQWSDVVLCAWTLLVTAVPMS